MHNPGFNGLMKKSMATGGDGDQRLLHVNPKSADDADSNVSEDSRPDDSQEEEKVTFVYEGHNISEIPQSVIETLHQRRDLQKLSLKGNYLRSLPAIVGQLSSLYYLNLSDNEFTQVPSCISQLQSLEILDMSGNQLQTLPDSLKLLPNLMGLSLVDNKIRTLPMVIGDLPKLAILELDDNPLQLPQELELGEDDDEEAWISSLRDYIRKLREESHPRVQIERSRSASESGANLRASKRMGFVMSRNATDQSYVASLHARGASYDAHMPNVSSNSTSVLPSLPNQSMGLAPYPLDSHGHARSLSSIPTSSEPLDLTTPRSPLPKSPFGSPWGSPRPSTADAEPQSSVSSRLSTLAEEHADSDTMDTEWDSPITDPSRGMSSVSQTDESRNPESSLFKDAYQDNTSTPISRHPSTARRQPSDEADTRGRGGSGPKSPVYPQAVFEKLREAMAGVSAFFQNHAGLLPTHLNVVLGDSLKLLDQENWYLSLNLFSGFLDKLTVPAMFQQIVSKLNRRQQRRFATEIIYAFPELEAAWRLVQQSKMSPLTMESSSANWAQDEQLHTQLNFAIKQMQDVLVLLNKLISRSAVAAADEQEKEADEPAKTANMVIRVRDLSSVCIKCSMATREVKKKLDRQSVSKGKLLQTADRRRFWDDINAFLKAIVSILAAVKTSLPDLPLLADKRVGVEVASLTRVAKEIPPLLEQSSYRIIMDSQPESVSVTRELATSGMSLTDLTGPGVLPPPTPLTASLGPAAQALVSPSDRIERPGEGYIQYGLRAHASEM